MSSGLAKTILQGTVQGRRRGRQKRMEDNIFVVLLFYVHGKHLRSCRDGQLT